MKIQKTGARNDEAITDFAKYLRGNMQALTQRQPIFFEDELKHIQYYLNLEQLRFGDKLHIIMDIGPTDFLVPALSVQPILDNAVKHGVTCRKSGGTIILRTEETPDALRPSPYWLRCRAAKCPARSVQ